jgi:hypothetical protein
VAQRHKSTRDYLIWGMRYGLPLALFVIGWVILLIADDSVRWDGWGMCLGAAGAILLINVLFRYGARGDHEREAEDAAREYYAEHGRWPDEAR